jgi:hypothetical protein
MPQELPVTTVRFLAEIRTCKLNGKKNKKVKVNEKLSLGLTTHHAMKTYGGVEI